MITLHFQKSISKNYKEAIKLSDNFDHVTHEYGTTIELPIKEIFEKWEMFNQVFWMVSNWKGSTVSYRNMTYHSNIDKSIICRALSDSKYHYMEIVADQIKNTYKEVLGQKVNGMTSEEADAIIELFTLKGREGLPL